MKNEKKTNFWYFKIGKGSRTIQFRIQQRSSRVCLSVTITSRSADTAARTWLVPTKQVWPKDRTLYIKLCQHVDTSSLALRSAAKPCLNKICRTKTEWQFRERHNVPVWERKLRRPQAGSTDESTYKSHNFLRLLWNRTDNLAEIVN